MSTDTRAAGAESDRDFVERMRAKRSRRTSAPLNWIDRLITIAGQAVTPPAAQSSEEEVRVHIASYNMGLRDGAKDPDKAKRFIAEVGPLMNEPGAVEHQREVRLRLHFASEALKQINPVRDAKPPYAEAEVQGDGAKAEQGVQLSRPGPPSPTARADTNDAVLRERERCAQTSERVKQPELDFAVACLRNNARREFNLGERALLDLADARAIRADTAAAEHQPAPEPVAWQWSSDDGTWQQQTERTESEANHVCRYYDGNAVRPLYAAPQPAPVDANSQAAIDVLAERRRQVEVEGWTSEHDDQHEACELAWAAAGYAMATDRAHPENAPVPSTWPWEREWWKPSSARRMLVKAGALILAEIERLDRAALKGGTP